MLLDFLFSILKTLVLAFGLVVAVLLKIYFGCKFLKLVIWETLFLECIEGVNKAIVFFPDNYVMQGKKGSVSLLISKVFES